VISVGNLTTGGTGKTPIVCFLAQWLRRRGLRVAIVSRGYGRGDADLNDEALELHDRLPDVPHVQDPDRVEAARVAVEELESQVILMDDGFQHRRLERDLDIVVIDATCPFGYDHLLPRGLLREPVTGLDRAGLVMLTRCGLVDGASLEAIENRIREVNSHVPLVRCDHRPASLREFPDRELPLESLAASSVAVVSAIGNPSAFEKTVESCGASVVATRQLGDHDPYDRDTVQALRNWIESVDDALDQVICTHKDLVKLRTDRLAGKPLRALLIELTVDRNADALEEAMETTVEGAVRQ
jgi:tetraacyldisaccharide 4'-kinase